MAPAPYPLPVTHHPVLRPPHGKAPSLKATPPVIHRHGNAALTESCKPTTPSKAQAMSVYAASLGRGDLPDSFALPALLKSLAAAAALAEGAAVHAHAVKLGLDRDRFVRNGLMALYFACGERGGACGLFAGFPDRDVVSWTTLVSGHARMGFLREAVELFFAMADDGGVAVDAVAAAAAFAAAAELGDRTLSKKVHRRVAAKKVALDGIAWNALIDMYAKSGDTTAAHRYFRRMPAKNVVSWNTMISAFARAGELGRALALFREMQAAGLRPDDATFVGVLGACAQLGALDTGRWVHAYMGRLGRKADGVVGNALLDMYAKCGAVDQAREVFDAMAHRDVYTYTSMILGFAMHGRGPEGLTLFAEMRRAGVRPTEVTFLGVLSACCHAGLVNQGLKLFQAMSRAYGMAPTIHHYGCVADMLGRAGWLDEAEDLIATMPVRPDALIWGSLLAACRTYGDVDRAERVMQQMSEAHGGEADTEAGDYVLMSNMYVSQGRHGKAVQVRRQMRRSKIKKAPGCSLIEIDGVVHEFRALPDKEIDQHVSKSQV